MRRMMLASLSLVAVLLTARYTSAHCEVPCGIYADQARFEQMLENTTTIAKAIEQVHEMARDHHPQNINQAIRWVTTKEEHATDTQHIIAQYFMTQRIKSSDPDYVDKLTAAHAVMVAAMKCKQQADPAMAEALRESIYAFYTAYTGQQPQFHE